MIKKTNGIALLCAISLIIPQSVFPVTAAGECCLRNHKKESGEETVLSEEIPPRRGNGPESYEQHNPKRNEEFSETATTSEEHWPVVPTVAEPAYNWYCPHNKEGKIPSIPSEMSFIEEHGGFFLDRTVTENDKVIYLTFDAGYANENVVKILDTLKEEQVPAAFFVLEHLITANTDLVQRMAAEGHLVCNHTTRHKDMSTVTDRAAFGEELEKLELIYKEATGKEMAKYYRPPEGRFTETNLIHAEALGYKTIFWSFAYADWDNDKQMPGARAMEKVLGGTHNGEILLLHPTSATNAAILPELIRQWKAMGYRFGTLDELVCEG